LAARLGLKNQQVQRYKANRYATANLERLNAVADALEISVKTEVAFAR
jgi:transcriptional regulator with XRE-family HTH domain